MKNFIQKNFTVIVFVLMVLSFFKSCSDSRKISQITNELVELRQNSLTSEELNLLLEINGLRTEHRFIQSTNRTIFDVKRQSEIEQEIQALKNKLSK